MDDDKALRRQGASMLLSATGALVAGLGLGALLAEILRPAAVPILLAGLAAHLVGMIGSRRLKVESGYRYAGWETAAYWLCWALIALTLGYAAWQFSWP